MAIQLGAIPRLAGMALGAGAGALGRAGELLGGGSTKTQVEETRQARQDLKDYYERKIALSEENGEKEEAAQVRRSYGELLEAFGAQDGLEKVAGHWAYLFVPRREMSDCNKKALSKLLAQSQEQPANALSSNALFFQANAMYRLERFQEALDAYVQALEAHPNEPSDRVLRVSHEVSKAVRGIPGIGLVDVPFADIAANRAMTLLALGQRDVAFDVLTRALSLGTFHPEALYVQATLLASRGESSRAVRVLRRAIRSDAEFRTIARGQPEFNGLLTNKQFTRLVK